jgi:hypothetical protein
MTVIRGKCRTILFYKQNSITYNQKSGMSYQIKQKVDKKRCFDGTQTILKHYLQKIIDYYTVFCCGNTIRSD